MIKNDSKLLIPIIVGVLLGVTLAVSPSFAQTNDKPVSKSHTCAAYSDKSGKEVEKAANVQAKIDAMRASQLGKLNGNRAKNDQKLANTRLAADQKRAQLISKLFSKASTTDAQKAALSVFKSSVNAAVVTRRTSIDTAIATYRTALNSAMASHQSSVDKATSTYKNAVVAAYAKALSGCQANVDQKTIKKNLAAALKAAKQAFEASRHDTEKLPDIIAPLAKTRQQAISAAEANFKTALSHATTILKAAFPKKK